MRQVGADHRNKPRLMAAPAKNVTPGIDKRISGDTVVSPPKVSPPSPHSNVSHSSVKSI
jgi:hypothetical protein